MKKYEVSIKKFDELNKIQRIYDRVNIIVGIVAVISWVLFMVSTHYKDIYFKNLFATTTVIFMMTWFALPIISRYVSQKFIQKNLEFMSHFRKDIQKFVDMKNDGYDKDQIRKEIKEIIDSEYSDKNKLTDKIIEKVGDYRFSSRVQEYISYCSMEKYYDVDV